MRKIFTFLLVMLVLAVPAFAANMGVVNGTGADLTVRPGFVPNCVLATNINNGASLRWQEGMTDDQAIRTIAVIDNATTGLSSISVVVNGITPVASDINATTGAMLNAPGFAIGADPHVNQDGNDIYWSTCP